MDDTLGAPSGGAVSRATTYGGWLLYVIFFAFISAAAYLSLWQ